MNEEYINKVVYWKPSGGSDADAIAYLEAVGIVNDSTLYTIGTGSQIAGSDIYNYFSICFAGIKEDLFYTKIKAMYFPFWGTSVKNKWNAVNPLDADAAFRLTYNGTITHSATGMKGDNATGWCNTHLTPSIHLTNNENHISVYNRENNTYTVGDHILIGTTYAGGSQGLLIDTYNNTDLFVFNNGWVVSGAIPNIRGLLSTSRTAINSAKTYRNGSVIASTTTTSSYVNYNGVVGLLGTNGGLFTNTEVAFASIGNGLNDTEMNALNSRISTLLTTLNIAV